KIKVHLVAAIVMNVLNVVLCYAFIFGRLGAPEMGVAGAGFAGFVSTYVGLAIMVGYAARPEYLAYRPFDLRALNRSLIWDILKLSIPSAIATIAVMTGFGLVLAVAGKLDQGAEVAVNGAATTDVVGIL